MHSRYLFAVPVVVGLALMLSQSSPADEAPSKEKIDQLIEQMGSGTFAEREKATKELAAIGVPALEALRRAAASDDAEIRRRAGDLIPKIEIQAESLRVLAPKRVHLLYKDTPLAEAVADFQKKSGYSIHLHDPEGKLKERKITLDSGETTFWRAVALFCDQAKLTEGTMQDLVQVPPPPAGGAAPPPVAQPAPVRTGRVLEVRQIILKGGKEKKRPTDDRSAIRLRALGKSDAFGNAPQGEVILPLEISPEPRLQWQTLQSVHLERAVDDQDQELTQVIPQVEAAGGFGGGKMAFALPGGGVVIQQVMLWDGFHQQAPVQLKKGAKTAKSLKELKGTITAQLLTEARPMIVADKLDKAAGKVFKGGAGGSLKIVEVKEEEQQTVITLEFEQPPAGMVVPAQQAVPPGMGVAAPVRLPRLGKDKPAPAPAGVAIPAPAPPPQIGVGAAAVAVIGPGRFTDPINGLTVQDDKGNALPVRIHQTQFRVMRQANGVQTQTIVYTVLCQHDKEKGQPAKVVYLGRKRATIEIPFSLKDVPLP